MTDNAAVSPVESVDVVSPESLLKEARERSAALEARLNELVNVEKNLNTALRLSEARCAQLEANIEALREQRDLFVERDADALVDKILIGKMKDRDIADRESQLKAVHAKNQPLLSQLGKANANLNELREKFGHVKHSLKEAESCNASLQEHNLDLQDHIQEIRAAVLWYMEISRRVKFSIPYRVEKALNVPFSVDHLLAGFRRSKAKKHNLSARPEGIAEFIVRAVRTSAAEE